MGEKKSAKQGDKKRASRRLSVYANLSNKRKSKKDKSARQRAEYLASLPKHPVKRFFYRLHPKRVAKFWFSKRGLSTFLKIAGVSILLAVLVVGGLFAYYRKDLDKIRPGEIAKRVQTTVTKYYDKNDVLLWEDKGTGNYKLVVESDQISDYLKEATIAIEDKDFYKHHGISIAGLTRAMVTNAQGGQVQGGSTLTQQLVKQVFFSQEEAQMRDAKGIPRKIKEMILAIEVERMYDKDQILTLYLNESPYGGRRNGAESAAQTYFHKSAKDLTLAEASLLASIPQNPSVFNPYNIDGHSMLIGRQHTTLDYMAEQGYITKSEAEEAKQFPILDSVQPLTDQLENIKAPHFVLMVRDELEKELGKAIVGRGGLTVKTTLDWQVQEKLETEMKTFFDSGKPAGARISNGAATVEDTQTGQIVALVGSRDFNYPGFGQDNAATAFIQPGSTIKPFVYAQLFKDKGAEVQNYGSGSILRDENIDKIYGAKLRNHDNAFMGNLTIRRSLALSRNIPAVKGMYISGIEETIDGIREMGNLGYCQPEEAAGGLFLSSSIGACGSRETDLVNAYSTLSRMGTYKPLTSILEVKNNQGETLKKWKDESKQVLDPQIAYIINDILADLQASAGLHGYGATTVPGVRTSVKTGTSDKDSKPKDLWIASYSPVLAMGMWLGNSDTSIIGSVNSAFGMQVVRNVMQFAHQDVYAKDNRWNSNMWYERPSGVQQVGSELYPSWWNKNQGRSNSKMVFDRVSKKKATECTPESAKIELEVTKITDPITKKDVFTAPDGYDASADDDVHSCDDARPSLSNIEVKKSGKNNYTISVDVSNGTFPLATIDFVVNGSSIKSSSVSSSGRQTATVSIDGGDNNSVTINIQDAGYYTASASASFKSDSSSD